MQPWHPLDIPIDWLRDLASRPGVAPARICRPLGANSSKYESSNGCPISVRSRLSPGGTRHGEKATSAMLSGPLKPNGKSNVENVAVSVMGCARSRKDLDVPVRWLSGTDLPCRAARGGMRAINAGIGAGRPGVPPWVEAGQVRSHPRFHP